MALPDKGDPQRPSQLAVRSMRIIAVLLLLPCALVALGSLSILIDATAYASAGSFIFLAFSLVVFGGPAAANLIFSIYLEKRRYWAGVAAIVLTSIELLISSFGATAATVVVIAEAHRTLGAVVAIVAWLVVIALAHLLQHLVRSLKAMAFLPSKDGVHGFDVLLTAPAAPLAWQRPPTRRGASGPTIEAEVPASQS